MNYKALISDFDNTLVGPTNQIDVSISNWIQKITHKGYIFAIATGRPYIGRIAEECTRINLDGPQIVSGGAAIINSADNTLLYAQYVSQSESYEIIEYLHSEGYTLLLQTEDKIYTTKGEIFPIFAHNKAFNDISNVDYSKILQIDLSPFIVKLTHEKVTELKKYLLEHYKDIAISIVHYGKDYGLNITSEKATKHTGVLEFMKLMKLKPEEVIGVGDGHNDYPLLSACGLKVAMGDAPDELKQIADIILPPQSEHGILTLFEKYF